VRALRTSNEPASCCRDSVCVLYRADCSLTLVSRQADCEYPTTAISTVTAVFEHTHTHTHTVLLLDAVTLFLATWLFMVPLEKMAKRVKQGTLTHAHMHTLLANSTQ
jgi:dolichyl-phosphate-mannose--protein O-mannosyl transferase